MRNAFALACALIALGANAAPNAVHEKLVPAGFRASVAAVALDPRVAEISGMALSHRGDAALWVHNDSDGGAVLYALDSGAAVIGTIVVEGERNQDWEDLAGYVEDGQPRLMIGDVGDNGGLREEIRLIVVDEPEPAGEHRARPRYVIRARWPDGPRDCEGIAVDAAAGEVLLISKKRVPAQLFRVALAPPASSDEVRVAEQIATIPGIPQPSEEELAAEPVSGKWRSQITSMDLDPAGKRLLLLTYRDAYLFSRGAGQAWREALFAAPQRLGMLALPQAEAIAFDRAGHAIWIATERLPAPLLRLEPAL
jgi:hypothetical protein